MKDNPQRNLIWQELHARPYVRFSAPAHALHFCFLTGEGTEEADRENLIRLKESLQLTGTYETPRHGIYAAPMERLGSFVLAWERHTEFVAYTFFLHQLRIPFRPFSFEFDEFLPANWLESLGGSPLVATRLAAGSQAQMPDTLDGLMGLFEGHTLSGSEVMAGRAEAWSCYRAHGDGFGRIALVVHEMVAPGTGSDGAEALRRRGLLPLDPPFPAARPRGETRPRLHGTPHGRGDGQAARG